MQSSKQKVSDFCFTIMPYGEWFDTYYNEIYAPAIKEAGLESKRADDLYRPSSIVHDIWQYTKECKMVLADLTGKNPNVLYELGLAHAIAKPVIIIVDKREDIPYDLRALRIIEYDKNAQNWGQLLKEKIINAIKEVKHSPIKAVPHAFLDAIKFDNDKKISTTKESLKWAKHITVIVHFEMIIEFHFKYSNFKTVQDFGDDLWYNLNKYIELEAYTYGENWRLKNLSTNVWIDESSKLNSGNDLRSLEQALIFEGDVLEVVFL